MTITTPALLFPAISLLLLAYTNRFLVLAQLIRELNAREQGQLRPLVSAQISNLKQRISLIRTMQVWSVLSFILCTAAMFGLFLQQDLLGTLMFGASLISLIISLIYSLYEVFISCRAIEIELSNIGT